MYYLFIFQTGHTALQRAAAEGHTEVVKAFLARGASLDQVNHVHFPLFSVESFWLMFFW